MKITIPDSLKADMPQTIWGRILTATPVVMTVVTTMLAGLASSEMTRAQYDRSLAAQLQSKAGDQWSFFQAKRLRGAIQHNTLDVFQALGEVRPLDPAALRQAGLGTVLDSPAGQQTLAVLQQGKLPELGSVAGLDPSIAAALRAIEEFSPEPDIAPLVAKIDGKTLDTALRAARDRVQALDEALRPVNQTLDVFEKSLTRQDASASPLKRDLTAARLRYAELRYDAEARLNQSVASLLEIQVRKGNLSAERHHRRSQRFFYGMLAAQAGVIIATFAMAARQRNLLWSLAAAAGVAAILFALYVYLYV